MTQKALFPGKSDIEQLDKIFALLGTPTEDVEEVRGGEAKSVGRRHWPGFNDLSIVKKVNFKRYESSLLRDFRCVLVSAASPRHSPRAYVRCAWQRVCV